MEKETAKQILNTLLEAHHVDSLSVVDISGEDYPEGCISVNLQLTAIGEIEPEEDYKTL